MVAVRAGLASFRVRRAWGGAGLESGELGRSGLRRDQRAPGVIDRPLKSGGKRLGTGEVCTIHAHLDRQAGGGAAQAAGIRHVAHLNLQVRGGDGNSA